MADPQQQFSDLPQGAKVASSPRQGKSAPAIQYSDLPQGAKLGSQSPPQNQSPPPLAPQINNADQPLHMFHPDTGAEQDIPRSQVSNYTQQGWQAGSAPKKEGFGASFLHAVGLPSSENEAEQMWKVEKEKSTGRKLLDAASSSTPLGMIVQGAGSGVNSLKKSDQELLQAAQAPTFGEKAAHITGSLGHLAAAGVPMGSTMEKAGEQIGSGDVSGGLGTTAGILAPLVVGKVAESRATAGKLAPSPRQTSVENLVKATAPDASDLGYLPNAHNGGKGVGFKGNADATQDIHIDYAKKNGIPQQVKAADTPGKKLEAASWGPEGAANNLQYFKEILGPNEGKLAPTNGFNGYEGETSGYNQATLKQLSTRLSEINAEKYQLRQAGGVGSDAATAKVNTARARQLENEAVGIRNTINQTLSKETGIPVEQLEPLRAQYGQLKDIADTMRLKAAQLQSAELKEGNKTVSESVPNHLTTNAMILKGGAKGIDKLSGHPIANALDKMYEYQPNPPAPLQVTPPAPSAPRTPIWQNLGIKPAPGGGPPPEIPLPRQSSSSPAIPAAEPGLLRPGTGKAPSSSPLPFGPQAAAAPIGEVAGRTMTVGEQFPEITGHSALPPEIQAVLDGGQPRQLNPASSIQLGPSGSTQTYPTPQPGGRTNPGGVPEHLTPKIDQTLYQNFRKAQGSGTPVTQKPDGTLQFHGTPEVPDYQQAIEKYGDIWNLHGGLVKVIENSSGKVGWMHISKVPEHLQTGDYRLAPRAKAAQK